jgi:hypothetical protein
VPTSFLSSASMFVNSKCCKNKINQLFLKEIGKKV